MRVLMLPVVLGGLTALAGVYRLLIGPTQTDRVVGLDLLFAAAILFCLLAAWVSQRNEFLDVAIGLALTGFVATLSWARLIQNSPLATNPEQTT